MSTQNQVKLRIDAGKYPPRIVKGREGASQDWGVDELLYLDDSANKYVTKAGTLQKKFCGISNGPASGTTAEEVLFTPLAGLQVEMNVNNTAGTAVSAYSLIGKCFPVEISSGKAFVKIDETDDPVVKVVAMGQGSAGDTNGFVIVEFLPEADQLAPGMQVVQYCGTTAGTKNAQTIDANIPALQDGLTIKFKAGLATDAAATLDVASMGAKKMYQGSDVATQVGASANLVANGIYTATYNSSLDTGSGGWQIAEI